MPRMGLIHCITLDEIPVNHAQITVFLVLPYISAFRHMPFNIKVIYRKITQPLFFLYIERGIKPVAGIAENADHAGTNNANISVVIY